MAVPTKGFFCEAPPPRTPVASCRLSGGEMLWVFAHMGDMAGTTMPYPPTTYVDQTMLSVGAHVGLSFLIAQITDDGGDASKTRTFRFCYAERDADLRTVAQMFNFSGFRDFQLEFDPKEETIHFSGVADVFTPKDMNPNSLPYIPVVSNDNIDPCKCKFKENSLAIVELFDFPIEYPHPYCDAIATEFTPENCFLRRDVDLPNLLCTGEAIFYSSGRLVALGQHLYPIMRFPEITHVAKRCVPDAECSPASSPSQVPSKVSSPAVSPPVSKVPSPSPSLDPCEQVECIGSTYKTFTAADPTAFGAVNKAQTSRDIFFAAQDGNCEICWENTTVQFRAGAFVALAEICFFCVSPASSPSKSPSIPSVPAPSVAPSPPCPPGTTCTTVVIDVFCQHNEIVVVTEDFCLITCIIPT